MGMYDQLRTKRIMPDGFQMDDWYQTKSMECLLTDYEIGEDGLLYEIDDSEPYPRGKIMLNYTGEIVFYASGKDYRATFIDGKLEHLELAGNWPTLPHLQNE